jgi:hypothetical protein
VFHSIRLSPYSFSFSLDG